MRLAVVFFSEKSESPSPWVKSVGIVIPCFGLETYSGVEILYKNSLGGGCREIPEPPYNLCLPLFHILIFITAICSPFL